MTMETSKQPFKIGDGVRVSADGRLGEVLDAGHFSIGARGTGSLIMGPVYLINLGATVDLYFGHQLSPSGDPWESHGDC